MTEKTVNKAPRGRPTRSPVGYRNRLTVLDKDPNRVYRWVNTAGDGGDRVAILEELGYRKESKNPKRTRGARVTDGTPLGDFEVIPGGGGDTLVLMSIEKDWFDDDRKAKDAIVNERESAQHKTPDGLYGSIKRE